MESLKSDKYKCIGNYKGSVTLPQNFMNFDLRTAAFHFIARLCRWRSASGTPPNFAEWWTVNCANNREVGSSLLKKIGANKALYICSFFGDFKTLW